MKTFFRFFISKTFFINLAIMIVLTFVILFITFSSLKSYTGHGEEFSLPDFSGMTMEQAQKLAKQKELRFEIMDSVFSRRKKRGSIVEQDPPAGFKVKKGRRVFLVMNATQPEMIRMPLVKDVDFKQAWMDLEAYGLSVDKISYEPNSARHLVIEQKYRGLPVLSGDRIEKGSGIELVLGSGLDGNRTSVPSLLGLTLKSAKRKLLNYYLNLGAVNFDRSVLTYEDSLNAIIWKHRPNVTPRKSIRAGAAVNLWLTRDTARVEADSTQIKLQDTLQILLENPVEDLIDSTGLGEVDDIN